MKRRLLIVITAFVAALGTSGCGFTGVNSLPLPFSKGSGAGAVHVTVYLADSANLVNNSEVRYREAIVGSVRSIHFDGWRAKLDIGLEPSARVPANVTAKVAQKSLLGAEYLELSSSDDGKVGATYPIKNRATIDLDHTGRYPETEEVLAGAAMLFNNGGLPQVRTIVHELNSAFGGREDTVREYVAQLSRFVGTLNDQRTDIVQTLEHLNSFARGINDRKPAVQRALRELPRGVDLLESERADLIRALKSVAELGDTTHTIVQSSGADLRANVASLASVTRALADTGTSIGRAFNGLTNPFAVSQVHKVLIGDYLNLFTTIRVSAPDLEKYFLGGTPLDGLFSGLMGTIPSGTVVDSANPLLPESLTDPLRGNGEITRSLSGTPSTPAPPGTGTGAGAGSSNPLAGLLGLLGGK